MNSPFVSVIVLNYNGLKFLQTVLSSLEGQSFPRDQFEIILADNGSSDESCAYVAQHFPRVIIDRLEKNYGFAEGNNIAAKRARGQVLAFLNNDTEADTHWLSALVEAYRQHPDGIFGSQAFHFARRDRSANSVAKLMAWGIPTNINVYKQRQDLPTTMELSMYADAAGMLLSKSIFFELGGFDPSYFAYEEEKDLGWKGWLLGYRSYVVPTSVYYHHGGATLGEHSFRAIYLLWRNGLRNIIKYPSGLHVWLMLWWHIGYSLGSYVLIFSRAGRWSLIGAMFKAYGNLIIDLPRLLQQRATWQRRRVVRDGQLAELGLQLNVRQSLRLAKNFLGRRQGLSKYTDA